LDDSFKELSLRGWARRLMLSAVHYSRLLEQVNQLRRRLVVSRVRRTESIQGGPDETVGQSDRIYMAPENAAWEAAWDVTERLVLALRDVSSAHGARFVLVTGTNPIQVHPDASKRLGLQEFLQVPDLFYPERRLSRLGSERHFPVLTLADRIQALIDEHPQPIHGFANTSVGTGHWNEAGHAIVGRMIAEFLQAQGLLDG
jgi:hypothetical protein